MKSLMLILIISLISLQVSSQEIDSDLLTIKERMDNVIEARAVAKLELDVDFINMPVKNFDLYFQKSKPISYSSDHFIIIPKRGLDFTWNELFKHQFMTIYRGTEIHEGSTLKVLNVIPLDKKADYAIMTLKLDTIRNQIRIADITTKNEGSYLLFLNYENDNILPSKLTVQFELERIRIPLNFMGKDTEIDKEKLKNKEIKKGSIFLYLTWQEVLTN